jgi:soluble lytic murein transglycosylase-like protein
MIKKLINYQVPGSLDQRVSLPSSLSGVASPFNAILNQEMSVPSSLEKIFLDFLIKTIESILSKTDQADQWAPFSRIPFLGDGSFPSQPVHNNTLSEIGPGTSASKPKGQEIDEMIQGAADQYGVEPSLIKAVISIESNGNPQAVSPAGAQGLMQLMPRTAEELGVTDPFDPAQNIKAGTRYLSRLLDRYQGNQKLALAAYNWGMGNLEKNPEGLPRETRNYIARVEKQYQTYLNSSSTA